MSPLYKAYVRHVPCDCEVPCSPVHADTTWFFALSDIPYSLAFLMETFEFQFSLYCTYLCVCYVRTFFHVLHIALYKCFFITNPNQEDGVKEEGGGRGRGHLTPHLKVLQT